MVGKALEKLKAAAKGLAAKDAPSGASERIVGIPEIAVYSEVPFERVGVIGGTGVNVVTQEVDPQTETPAKKPVAKKDAASPSEKVRKKKSSGAKATKRKKAK